jgi:hypothetical protein
VSTYSEAGYSNCLGHLICSYNSPISEHTQQSPIHIYLYQVQTFPYTSAIRLTLLHTGTTIQCSAPIIADTAQEISKLSYPHYPTYAPFRPAKI